MNIYKPAETAPPAKRYVVDLSATMAVCDANYIRLLKLMPHFELGASRAFTLPSLGESADDNILQAVDLLVVEAFRYTTTIRISMGTASANAFYQPPSILVRMYHDASTAEVISVQEAWHNRVTPQPEDAPQFYADEKEQVNLFLAEWLTLCIDTGVAWNKIKLDTRTVPGLLPMS